MSKDNFFKNNFSILNFNSLEVKDFFYEPRFSATNEENSSIFNPDKLLSNEKDKHLIMCEHSSTGNRKTHIAELTLFFMLVNQCKDYDTFSYFLFVEHANNKLNPEHEARRLQIIIDNLFYLFPNSLKNRIDSIHVLNYSKELNGLSFECLCKKGKKVFPNS